MRAAKRITRTSHHQESNYACTNQSTENRDPKRDSQNNIIEPKEYKTKKGDPMKCCDRDDNNTKAGCAQVLGTKNEDGSGAKDVSLLPPKDE